MAGSTILIADDDPAIRTVLSQAVTRRGFRVRTTGTAANLWRLKVAVICLAVSPDLEICRSMYG